LYLKIQTGGIVRIACITVVIGLCLVAIGSARAGSGVVFGINDDAFSRNWPLLAPQIAGLGNIQVGAWRKPEEDQNWMIPSNQGVLLVLLVDKYYIYHPFQYAQLARQWVLAHSNIRELQVGNEPDLCTITCEAKPINGVRFYGRSLNRYFDLLKSVHQALTGTGVKELAFGFSSPLRHWQTRTLSRALRQWYHRHDNRRWYSSGPREDQWQGIHAINAAPSQPIMDGFAYHPYCGWQAQITKKVHQDLVRGFEDLPGGAPPIWFTEFGVDVSETQGQYGYFLNSPPAVGGCRGRTIFTEGDQVQTIRKVMKECLSFSFIGGCFNFLWQDETDLNRWQSGLERPDGSVKPAYSIFRQMVTRNG
jgi:hypothetical protein